MNSESIAILHCKPNSCKGILKWILLALNHNNLSYKTSVQKWYSTNSKYLKHFVVCMLILCEKGLWRVAEMSTKNAMFIGQPHTQWHLWRKRNGQKLGGLIKVLKRLSNEKNQTINVNKSREISLKGRNVNTETRHSNSFANSPGKHKKSGKFSYELSYFFKKR